jgi:hypothetical protein
MKHLAIKLLLAFSLSAATHATAQTPAQSPPAADPFKSLAFLEQNWEANTNGFNGVQSSANYTFRRLLGGHILSRVATSGTACKGPADFDCGHNDMLYIFQDAPGQPLKAIYFDNEGHVIHYDVTTPAPESVVFLSDPASPGPRFRLSYEVKNALLLGKFQMQLPGQTEWKSYLEWSGPKR